MQEVSRFSSCRYTSLEKEVSSTTGMPGLTSFIFAAKLNTSTSPTL